MARVMLLTFAFLSWAWFELSGGAAFAPGENGVRVLARMSDQPIVSTRSSVTRSDLGEAELTAFPGNGLAMQPIRVSTAVNTSSVAPRVQTAAVVQPVVTPIPTPEPAKLISTADPVAQPATVQIDYRTVTGNRVNLRSGPNTSFDVVTQLLKGEEVEILEDGGDGWVRLRALDGNDIGWMSAGFLVASN
ncbi:MAG: SH3 domain-containing protein [Pelagimonas sp.]|nr:SH3 domain-containing protein [Pelagimonas sp.]